MKTKRKTSMGRPKTTDHAVALNISIPPRLFERIERYRLEKERLASRSAVVREAVELYLRNQGA